MIRTYPNTRSGLRRAGERPSAMSSPLFFSAHPQRRFVLTGGQEALLNRIFGVPPQRAFGLRLLSIFAGRSSVEATYIDPQGGSKLVMELSPGHDPMARPNDVRVVPLADLPSPVARALAHLLTARAKETSPLLRWISVEAEPSSPIGANPELCAVLASVKPAFRTSIRPDNADNVAAALRDLGLHVLRAGQTVTFDGAAYAIVYGALDRAVAEALCDAEAKLHRGEEAPPLQREIGRLLGYPSCCVEAFCARFGAHQHPSSTLDDAYRSTRDAWVKAPWPRLNPLLFGERAFFVSFDPCSFNCPAALATANAIAESVRAREPEAADLLDRALATAVAIHPRGARAKVALQRGEMPWTIIAALPVRRVYDEPVTADEERFAASLIGLRVREDGWVTGLGSLEPPVIVADFATSGG